VTGNKAKVPGKPVKQPTRLAFPITCVTDDCDAQTLFAHPGNAPFKVGMFLDLGWVAMSEPGERSVLNMCPRCIAKSMVEVDEEMASARQSHKR
jgi:hypothetical protein